ncbi:MAG: cobalt ECF transporter T component CbiQ [Bryobacteraceae bacterium]
MRVNRFVEASIRGFLVVLEHALESEELARRRGLLQSLDPRVKVLGLLVLIVAAAISRRIEVIVAVFGLALLLAVSSRLPMRTLAIRVWAGVFAFTGLMVLPALFLTPGQRIWSMPWSGWTVTAQGLRAAAYLVSRVETTATLSMLLVLTTPWTHILKALRVLRVPVVVIVVLGMTYRYIFLLITTAREMFESRRSRLVGGLESGDRRRLAVATAGVLLSKTLQLSGDVYLAMQSRGFRGEVDVLDEFEMSAADWLGLLVFTGLGAAALWVGH